MFKKNKKEGTSSPTTAQESATRIRITLRYFSDKNGGGRFGFNASPIKRKTDWQDLEMDTEYQIPDHIGEGTFVVTMMEDKKYKKIIPHLVRAGNASPLWLPRQGNRTWLFTLTTINYTRPAKGGKKGREKGPIGLTFACRYLLERESEKAQKDSQRRRR